jgi:MFS family permease
MNRAVRILPASATPDATRLVATRALRGLADGAVSVVLASYLARLGFSPLEVGGLVTATLLGSAALTLALGLLAHRIERRRVLLSACGLMVATGFAFAQVTTFWPLLVVAFVGTINPSSGDVTLFLPTEQAVLAETSDPKDRVGLFAWYNVAGTLAGAVGALAAGLPDLAARRLGVPTLLAERAVFFGYSAVGLVTAALYAGLSRTVEQGASGPGRPLSKSRRVVLELSALFSLDSFGGGFVVQSLLALYLFRRFALSLETAAAFFFVASTSRPSPDRLERLPPHVLCDGVYAPSLERLPRRRRADAQRLPGDLLPPPAHGALADGRAGPAGVRDGGGPARGTRRRFQRHQRAPQPRRRALSLRRRVPARQIRVRMAPDRGRYPQGRLRSAPLRAVLEGAAARKLLLT